MKNTRIHRLLRALSLIQSGAGWTAEKLAAEFGISSRSIHRDMRVLERSGLGCVYDSRQRCYKVADGVFLPPVQVTAEEALALAALCEQVAGRQIPYLGAACRAIAKLRGVLPMHIRSDVDSMLASISIRTAAAEDPSHAADVYARFSRAIQDREVLLCRYDSPLAGDCGEFEFHPAALFFSVRAWYVIGRHLRHGDMRTLKLCRFISAKPAGRHFQRPADFSVDEYLGNAWRMMRGVDTRVELWFDAHFAPTIGDTVWHQSQEMEPHEDGSLTMRCIVSGLDEVVWWVLSMGDHCKVVKPTALARRVRELADRTSALYRQTAPGKRSRKKHRARRVG